MSKGIPAKVKKLVLARDNHNCQLGLPGCLGLATEADHRANRGMGGSDVLNGPECLIAACGLCNGAKEDATGGMLEQLLDRGVRVLKAATNAKTRERCEMTPVAYLDGRVCQLRTDGTLKNLELVAS